MKYTIIVIAAIIFLGSATMYQAVRHDSTLTGDGTTSSPLGVASSFSSTTALLAGRAGGQTLIGGTATTDDLILQTTSGIGTTGAEMRFQGGNNGATRFMTILNSGYVGIGAGATSPGYPVEIYGEGLGPNYVTVNLKVPTGAATNLSTSIGLESKYLSTTKNWFFGAGSGGSPNNNSFRIVEVGSPNVDWVSIAPTTGYMGINSTAADKALEVNLGTASAFRLTYNDNSGSAAVYRDETIGSTGIVTFDAVGSGSSFLFEDPIRPKGYTVATLPTGVTGMHAYVTDATAPTYLGALTGGGAVVCPVFYNGSAWVSH